MPKSKTPYSLEALQWVFRLHPAPLSMEQIRQYFDIDNDESIRQDLTKLFKTGEIQYNAQNKLTAAAPLSEIVICRLKRNRSLEDKKKKRYNLEILSNGKRLPIPVDIPVTIKHKTLFSGNRDIKKGDHIAVHLVRDGINLRAKKVLGVYSQENILKNMVRLAPIMNALQTEKPVAQALPIVSAKFKNASSSTCETSKNRKLSINHKITTLFNAAGMVPEKINPSQIYSAVIPQTLDPQNPTLEMLSDKHHPFSGQNITKIITSKHGITTKHSDQAKAEIEEVITSFNPREDSERRDLTHEPIMIVDPPNAHDHDDGILIEKMPDGNFRTLTVISDVAARIKPGSFLDQNAQEKGFTYYCPDGENAFPLFPQKLVKKFSLLTNKLRPVIYREAFYNANGQIIGNETIGRGVIRNQFVTDYETFQNWSESADNPSAGKPTQKLDKLSNWALFNGADQKAYQEFCDTILAKMRFEKGLTLDEGLVEEKGHAARSLVEFFMLEKNIATAEFLHKHAIPFPYRIHAIKNDDHAYQTYREKMGKRGYKMPDHIRHLTPEKIQTILSEAEQKNDRPHVERLMMSYLMGLGQYALKNKGHFSLGVERYAQSTSPIRRYNDIMVQRSLHQALNSPQNYSYSKEQLANIEPIVQQMNTIQAKHSRALREHQNIMAFNNLHHHLNEGNAAVKMRINNITEDGIEISWDKQHGLRKWIAKEDLPQGWKIAKDSSHLTYNAANDGKTTYLPEGGNIQVTIGTLFPMKYDYSIHNMVPTPKQPKSILRFLQHAAC